MSELSAMMSSSESERRWAYVVAGVIGFVFAVIIFSSVHLGSPAAVERRNDRRQPPASRRRIRGGEPRHGSSARRLGDRARHCAAILVRSLLHRRARQDAGRFPRDQPRRRARISHHGHQCEQHGGAGIHRRSANAVRQAGRSFDAVSRVLQRRSRGHVGACQGRRSTGVRASPTVANRERPVQGSSRLVLAHFWAAFAAFAVAIPLGAWQMLVRSPLHQWVAPELYYRAVTAHGTTFAYVFPTLIAMGFGYAVCAVSLGRPMRGLPLAWISF